MKKGRDLFLPRLVFSSLAFLAISLCPTFSFVPGNADAPFQRAFQKADQERKEGKFVQSIASFKEALSRATGMKDQAAETACLMKLGLMHWNTGEIDLASNFYGRALSKSLSCGSTRSREECRTALEIIRNYKLAENHLDARRDCRQSLKCIDRALVLSAKIGQEDFTGKCLHQKSFVYWEMNKNEDFKTYTEEALKIARDIKNRREEGACLNNMGIYYRRSNDFCRALNFYQDALQISQETSNLQHEAGSLHNIGLVYWDLGDYHKTLDYQRRALRIDRRIGEKVDISYDLNCIGMALEKIGTFSNRRSDLYEALSCFDECLRLLQGKAISEIEIYVLNNKGYINLLLGDYTNAISCLNQALRKAENRNSLERLPVIWTNLGHVYLRKNNSGKALSFFQKAVNESAKYKRKDILWECLFGLAQCFEKRGRNRLALDYYRKSMKTIEAVRGRISLDLFKAGYDRDKVTVFESAVDLLYRLNASQLNVGSVEEMFSIVERIKARAFFENLAKAGGGKNTLSLETQAKQAEINKQIASLISDLSQKGLSTESREGKILKLDSAEDRYVALISAEKPDFRDSKNSIDAEAYLMPELRRECLDEDTGLLEYFLGEKRSYLFFITRQETRLFELPSRDKMEESLRGYLRALTASDLSRFEGERAAERIAGEVLFPLSSPSAGRLKKLIIVPDGILCCLPFETLRIGEKPDSHSSYLIEKYEVSYAPSSTSLVYLSRKRFRQRGKTLLAFGQPFFGEGSEAQERQMRTARGLFGSSEPDFDFASLPFSRKEVQDISRHFPAESRNVFLDREASEKAVKKMPLQDYRIIHFACHGLLDEAVPLRSALVLSPDGKMDEDGFLQAREIYDLKMGADLVVLSACQSGRGCLEIAEGMMGLARVFFYAGAKSVVSTLWPIKDRSTALLMNEFYDSLSKGYGKAHALRSAKIKMIASKKYSHPFYWAAFLLNGDFGPAIEPAAVKEAN